MKNYKEFHGIDLNTDEKSICRKSPITALQMYRRRTGLGLMESRDAIEHELGMDILLYGKVRDRIAFALFYQDNIIENDLSEFSDEDFRSSLNSWKKAKNYLREEDVQNFDKQEFDGVLKNWRNNLNILNEEPWKDGKHCGDCTDVPLTCHRCYIEYYYDIADKIMKLDNSELMNE